MLSLKARQLSRTLTPAISSCKGIYTSSPSCIDHRKKKAITRHLNYVNHEKTLKHNYSPIVTLPDYTYLDGRPTEIMLSQKEREEKNHELAKRVVQLVDEMKLAQQLLKEQKQAESQNARQRQESQLKHKEHELT